MRRLKRAAYILCLTLSVLLVGDAAFARHVNPAGLYSESELKDEPPTQIVKAKIKGWVKEGARVLKGFFGNSKDDDSSEKADVAAQVPGARNPANESRAQQPPTTTASGNSPSSSSPSQAGSDPSGTVAQPIQDIVKHEIADGEEIPRLSIPSEPTLDASRYSLPKSSEQIASKMLPLQLPSPELISYETISRVTAPFAPANSANAIKLVTFLPKGKVDRRTFDKFELKSKPESALQLAKFVELTDQEVRFLSGLLLYTKGNRCATAIGLFHELSKHPDFKSEADYYLAMCSRQMALKTDFMERAGHVFEAQDVYYSQKLLRYVEPEVEHDFVKTYGDALVKASSNPKIMQFDNQEIAGNVAFAIAAYASHNLDFKAALKYAPLVPNAHPKKMEARFLHAAAEYQAGSKEQALKMQADLIKDLNTDKSRAEFQALIALNLGRMHFQERNFKEARENFLKVYKDHPLWVQSLNEMGWAQLMSGDYEGAIGNMYSIQSPFFSAVYKPESFVIRSIGYLNLCQYGDAYRTLTRLEKEYRPWLVRILDYKKNKHGHFYQTAKNFVRTKGTSDVDGLPSPVVREMVRYRDFINLQKSLNRQLDERDLYTKFESDVDRSLKTAQFKVNSARQKAADLRSRIGALKTNPSFEIHRTKWVQELEEEIDRLNGYFFEVDLYKEAKRAILVYRTEVVQAADKRISAMKSRIEGALHERLNKMASDLQLMLENNELLRYEVFSGSGENIRYQVSGGEKGQRVPASVLPKSKSLQWEFEGEYWEDEIGNYRSSLKNNCPESKAREQASLGGM